MKPLYALYIILSATLGFLCGKINFGPPPAPVVIEKKIEPKQVLIKINQKIKMRPKFYGFGKQGEKVSEKDGVYMLEGKGTDIGCNLVFQEDILRPSFLELEVRGKIDNEAQWTRLRIEIYDKDKPNEPADSFEGEYLNLDLSEEVFKKLTFPVLGIVKCPCKVQFMIVGPANSKLEIKNVSIR